MQHQYKEKKDFINFGIDKFHDKTPHLRENDTVCVYDKRHGIPLKFKVKKIEGNVTKGHFKTYSLEGYDMYKVHKSYNIDTTFDKAYNHTQATLKDVAHMLHQRDSSLVILPKKSKIKEQELRNKYPDYPYKKLNTFTKSKNGQNYEINQGLIIDKDLAKSVGSPIAYYQKALDDFAPNACTTKNNTKLAAMGVLKGQISGPIVPSTTETIQKKQLNQIHKVANNAELQNFWLDDNSSLIGNWNMPQKAFLRDTQITNNSHDPAFTTNINNSWLTNSRISTHDKPVNLNNVGLYMSNIDDHSKDRNAISLQDSTVSNVWAKLTSNNTIIQKPGYQDKLSIDNSYVENAHIGNDVRILRSKLSSTDSPETPSEIDNSYIKDSTYVSPKPLISMDKTLDQEHTIEHKKRTHQGHGAVGSPVLEPDPPEPIVGKDTDIRPDSFDNDPYNDMDEPDLL